ncbi:MAG: two-component regulator propeller domain-containing protein [Saprospiraceae bacterium]
MTPKILLTYLLVFLFTLALEAQSGKLPVYHYPYKLYSIQDGLSQTQCMSIFQDSKGFIWVGTKEGINRFDGLQFINYKTDPIFPKDYIKDIDEDKKGHIWFTSDQGIYKYDGDTLINYFDSDHYKFIPQNIEYDPEINQFWITTHTDKSGLQLGLLDLNGRIKPAPIKLVNIKEKVSDICYDKNGQRLLLLTYLLNNFSIYAIKNKKTNLIQAFNRGKLNYHIHKGKDSEVYLTIDNTILKIEKNNSFTFIDRFPCDNCFIRGFNNFLVVDYNEFFLKQENVWINAGIELNRVNDFILSKGNNIWAATEEGLVKFLSSPFQHYPKDRGMLRYVWDINEGKDGEMWFSSYGFGLAALKNNSYTYPPAYNGELNKRYFYMGGITTSKGDVLFPDETNILAYNSTKGFYILKGTENQKPVLYIYEDTTNQRLLLGTNGLKIIEQDQTVKFYGNKEGLDIERFRYIIAIEKDKNENFWLASHRGLSKFDGRNFKNFYPKKDIKSGVVSIHRDYKDNLWFGTHDGLLLYNYKKELPQPVLEQELSETINFITSIDSSYLIVGLLDKLFILDLKAYYKGLTRFHYFDKDSGYDGGEVGQNAFLVDKNKTVWIATSNNIIRLFSEQLTTFDTLKPSVFLSNLELIKFSNGEVTKSFNLLFNKDSLIKINSKENHIRLHWLTTHENNPSQIRYQYKLVGYDTAWSPLANHRFMTYTNLSIKQYTFLVKACKYGRCSESKSISIEVYPSNFWERSIIKSLLRLRLLIIGIFVLWLIKKVRDRHRKNFLKLQHQLDVLKLENIHNQVEPHFFFNALRSISDLVGTAQKNFIAGIGQMLRPVIQGNKNMMRTLAEEIAYVETYVELENIKFENRIKLTVQIASNVNLDALVPKTIIQTFVNNAVKHGLEAKKGGEIKVLINQNVADISISIEDNGIGRVAASKNSIISSGNGIRIIQETLEWLNQNYPVFQGFVRIIDLKDDLNFPLGTMVKIHLYSKYQQH